MVLTHLKWREIKTKAMAKDKYKDFRARHHKAYREGDNALKTFQVNHKMRESKASRDKSFSETDKIKILQNLRRHNKKN